MRRSSTRAGLETVLEKESQCFPGSGAGGAAPAWAVRAEWKAVNSEKRFWMV